MLTDINAKRGVELASELGVAAHFIRHDVRDAAEWDVVVSETVARFG